MSRHDDQRLADVLAAASRRGPRASRLKPSHSRVTNPGHPPGGPDAIADHLQRGDLDGGLVFDAVRVRLIEIGEAVKAVDAELLAKEPDIPWIDVVGMRDQLAHRYFDTAHSIVRTTVIEDLPPLVAAANQLLNRLRD